MKTASIIVLSLLAVTVAWLQAAPPGELEIADAVEFGDMDPELEKLARSGDIIGSTGRRSAERLPGYDDVVALADESLLASGMDGWIWRIDPITHDAEQWIDAPLMPAGMRRDPVDQDVIFFCSARLHGQDYPAHERVGLYSLTVSTKRVHPVVLDVPLDERSIDGPAVFAADVPTKPSEERPLAFCNDLDVSSDGQRIYFSEPFAYEGASMGGGAFAEAIALGRNGRLWMHDRETGSTRLIAHGFHFLDGVLIEPAADGGREPSILITETTHFQIQRLTLRGPGAGKHEIIWRDLPGMPDGMDRDAEGHIWIGLLSLRSPTTNWVHSHPWIKPLLLRLPTALIPKGESTGLLALDSRAERPLFLALHDGSFVRDISVAIPVGDRIHLASFDPHQRGLVSIPRPID